MKYIKKYEKEYISLGDYVLCIKDNDLGFFKYEIYKVSHYRGFNVVIIVNNEKRMKSFSIKNYKKYENHYNFYEFFRTMTEDEIEQYLTTKKYNI